MTRLTGIGKLERDREGQQHIESEEEESNGVGGKRKRKRKEEDEQSREQQQQRLECGEEESHSVGIDFVVHSLLLLLHSHCYSLSNPHEHGHSTGWKERMTLLFWHTLEEHRSTSRLKQLFATKESCDGSHWTKRTDCCCCREEGECGQDRTPRESQDEDGRPRQWGGRDDPLLLRYGDSQSL